MTHKIILSADSTCDLGHVYPVNSCNLSTGSGLLVVAARRMIDAGMDAPSIASALKQHTGKCHASLFSTRWPSCTREGAALLWLPSEPIS